MIRDPFLINKADSNLWGRQGHLEDGGEPGNGTPGIPPGGMQIGQRHGGIPGMNDGVEPGLFRMGDAGMSGQISWLLLSALIGVLAWIRRPSWPTLINVNEKPSSQLPLPSGSFLN